MNATTRDDLITRNYPRAMAIAHKVTNSLSVLDPVDVKSWAAEGLLIAVDEYLQEPSPKYALSTYIKRQVRWSIFNENRRAKGRVNSPQFQALKRIHEGPRLHDIIAVQGSKSAELRHVLPAQSAPAVDLDFWRTICKSLSKRERLILILHYIEGLNFTEVGENLQLSKTCISIVHARLIRNLSKRGTVRSREVI